MWWASLLFLCSCVFSRIDLEVISYDYPGIISFRALPMLSYKYVNCCWCVPYDSLALLNLLRRWFWSFNQWGYQDYQVWETLAGIIHMNSCFVVVVRTNLIIWFFCISSGASSHHQSLELKEKLSDLSRLPMVDGMAHLTPLITCHLVPHLPMILMKWM